MNRFLKRLGILVLIPTLGYAIFAQTAMPWLLRKWRGQGTEEEIRQSFSQALSGNAAIIFAGSSRLHVGVDPDFISVPSYNFSGAMESYNQTYYKLLYLDDHGVEFDMLFLGIDYFQFSIISDLRNYVYGDLLSPEYLKDYDHGLGYYRMMHYVNYWDPIQLSRLRPLKERSHIEENGHKNTYGKLSKIGNGIRTTKRLALQEKYFEAILDHCEQRGIRVVLVMPPSRKVELSDYSLEKLDEFNSFLAKYENGYEMKLDFSESVEFTDDDFDDPTHMNQAASKRFSLQLNDSIELYWPMMSDQKQ